VQARQPVSRQPQAKKIEYEPVPTNERGREQATPAGLKNVGNTCYFASLIQSLFNLPNIQEKILNYDYIKQVEVIKNIDYSKEMDHVEKIKMKKSVELIRAL